MPGTSAATGANAPAASTGRGANAPTGANTVITTVTPAPKPAGTPEGEALVPLTAAEAPPLYTYDPWERLNRFMYRFNARFDEAVFLPAADTYRRLPAPLRLGVHNFFGNLSEVGSVVNYGLQLRLLSGVRALGRFLINSTLGLGGLFDVATKVNLTSPATGVSATLATWGMHPGPFLVLPILGPSTLRDGVGYLGDLGIAYEINLANLERGNKTYALSVLNAVDQRSNISFRYYATGSPFEYETIRFLFVRKTLIEDEALHRGKRKRDATAPAGK